MLKLLSTYFDMYNHVFVFYNSVLNYTRSAKFALKNMVVQNRCLYFLKYKLNCTYTYMCITSCQQRPDTTQHNPDEKCIVIIL